MSLRKYLTRLLIIIGAAAYLIGFDLYAAPPLLDADQVAASAPPIMEILKADPKSVSGTLNYKQGINLETLVFGETTGLYGTGLVLHSSALPGEMGQLFKGKHALQIALGNSPSATDKIPQFGSVTLIFNKIPTKPQTFKTVFPKPPFPGDNVALILFSSPQSPRARNDEDRLKGSFFAQNGTIILTPVGKPQTVMAPHRGEQMAFKTQVFRLEFNSLLVTPFTNEGADLKGKLELPVFWPDGKESESLIKHLSFETLGASTAPLVAPESVPHHNREVTGSSKKPKPE